MSRQIRAIMILVSLFSFPAWSGASVPVDASPWFHDELELREEGIPTDTDSLVVAAQEASDFSVQYHALRVLTLRREPQAKMVARDLLSTSPEPIVRRTAAWSLAYLDDPQGIPALRELFQSRTTPEEKLRIAETLAEFGDSTTWPYVQAAASDEDPSVRQDVVDALVPLINLDQAGSVDLLIAMAGDPSPDVRKEAASAMGRVDFEKSVGQRLVPVLHALETQDLVPDVRLRAWSTLKSWQRSEVFSSKWLEEEAVVDHGEREAAIHNLSPPWSQSYSDLRKTLLEEGIEVEPSRLVQSAWEHESPELRQAAIRLLAWRRNRDAKPLFLQQLRQESSTERERLEAAWALAVQEDPVGVEYLNTELKRAKPSEQIELAILLAGLGDATGYPRVVELAHSADERLAKNAIEALLKFLSLRTEPGVDPIGTFKRLVETDPETSDAILEALTGQSVICDPQLEGLVDVINRKAGEREGRLPTLRTGLLDLQWRTWQRACRQGDTTEQAPPSRDKRKDTP